jgi:hypothetical protein
LEKLTEQKYRTVTAVEFNPWLVSGEETITANFFAEIGAKLSQDTKDESVGAGRLHGAAMPGTLNSAPIYSAS